MTAGVGICSHRGKMQGNAMDVCIASHLHTVPDTDHTAAPCVAFKIRSCSCPCHD